MVKLYPPYIENTLPAFDKDSAIISVPFQINRAVNHNDFKQLAIIIKTVSSGAIKVENLFSCGVEYDYDNGYYIARFDISNIQKDFPQVGQFYKVQIAFVRAADQQIGYYSTIGVIKCTAKPDITIDKLKLNGINQHIGTYIGKYSQTDKDPTERVYSYQFTVKDKLGNVVATSGEQLHNSSTDVSATESQDSWTMEQILNLDEEYEITYQVKTLNNYITASDTYRIMEMNSKSLDHLGIELRAENEYGEKDDGYIKIFIRPDANHTAKPNKISGHFILMRASSKNEYRSWHEIYRFDLQRESGIKELWNDFSIEQGITYRYCIQAYNEESVYSNRLLSNDCFADFEDCFLFDGEKQLKIRFNPKVSSFKRTILESKVDTLGGKHPFIFRNGRVDYKEFPISGLVSLISDPNEFFMKGVQCADLGPRSGREADRNEDILKVSDSKTDLTAENYYQERQFKMAALEWLSDGKPKLFRSAAEGNYIVRLMNVSLSPVDSLGRMLHSFQCTAYEIAECTFTNLEKYGFIKGKTPANKDIKIVELKQVKKELEEYATILLDGTAQYNYDFPGSVQYLRFEDFFDEVKFKVVYQDGSTSEDFIVNNTTNNYYVAETAPIIRLITNDVSQIPDTAKLTYGYYEPALTSDFVHITNIEIEDKIVQYNGCVSDRSKSTIDLLPLLADGIRTETGRFHYISLNLRPIETIFKNGDKYYNNPSFEQDITLNDNTLYYVSNENYYLDGGYRKDKLNYTAYINNNDYTDLSRHKISDDSSIEVAGRFEALKDVESVRRFEIGDALVANIVYQLKTITYSIEDTNQLILAKKNKWIAKENEVKNTEYDDYYAYLADLQEAQALYKDYIKTLDEQMKLEIGEVVYAI